MIKEVGFTCYKVFSLIHIFITMKDTDNENNNGFEENQHPKQKFQVERLAFFSDAIFAIAITLLVIEFKVPHITKESTFQEVWQELLGLKYNFIALVFSFWIISGFWVKHHFLFKHIKNYNGSIIRMNLVLMLTMIFFPFTTTFYSDSIDNHEVFRLAFGLFALNNVLAHLSIFILSYYVFVQHKEFSYSLPKSQKNKLFIDNLFFIGLFLLLGLFSFYSNNYNAIIITICILVLIKNTVERILKVDRIKYY